MFSVPSLSKLLLLVAIISAIWFGFRLLGQIERHRRQSAPPKKRWWQLKGSDSRHVDDMVKCQVCGAFTAPGGKSCGKPGCPY
jgi:uncharacterized protein